jgi:tRNA nucleotidyltransferase (CCA-adding enzyme)
LSDGNACEITTYRIDGEYEDNRKPKNVLFTDSLTDDLSRRDFTINAIAYNEKAGIVDPFGGVNDIKFKKIRAVGNPDKRFNEDALRMLRAIRFSAKLDFDIESETYSSIQKNAYLLKNISAERINDELTGFLLAGKRYELLYDSGICDIVLSELSLCFKTEQNNKHHIYNVIL